MREHTRYALELAIVKKNEHRHLVAFETFRQYSLGAKETAMAGAELKLARARGANSMVGGGTVGQFHASYETGTRQSIHAQRLREATARSTRTKDHHRKGSQYIRQDGGDVVGESDPNRFERLYNIVVVTANALEDMWWHNQDVAVPRDGCTRLPREIGDKQGKRTKG